MAIEKNYGRTGLFPSVSNIQEPTCICCIFFLCEFVCMAFLFNFMCVCVFGCYYYYSYFVHCIHIVICNV